MKIHIFGAGSYPSSPKFKPKIKKGDYVIAADGGIKYLASYNIKPQIIVGDFDSFSFNKLIKLVQKSNKKCQIIKLNPQKDFSDTEIAVMLALKKIKEEKITKADFILWGSLGGRIDHSIANIQVSLALKKRGHNVYLVGEKQILSILSPGEYKLPNQNFLNAKSTSLFSLFALSPEVSSLSLKNCAYEADNIKLSFIRPLALSNQFKKDKTKAILSFKKGLLLYITNFA